MSVEEPGAAESFTFRIRKTVIAAPQVRWYNTYEARFVGAGTSEDLDSLMEGLILFETTLLLNLYKVDQVTISTWLPDGTIYNPMSFVTNPRNDPGLRPLGIDKPVDLQTCLFIKRTVESGRIGRIFLRGSLVVGDLTAVAGQWALADSASMAAEVAGAVTDSALASNFEGGAGNPHLALIGAEQVTRQVQGFVLGGVSQVKLNHKWFDRA